MKTRSNPLSATTKAEPLRDSIRELELDDEELLPSPEAVRELQLQESGDGDPALPELGNEDLVLPILDN